jgi:flagellar protein FlbT
MSGTFKVYLKTNERLFINGAVIRADRKVSIELLNDVDFLLESHVMQSEDATTPLRQLYYIIQIIVMSPAERARILPVYKQATSQLVRTLGDRAMLSELQHIDTLVGDERYYDALKALRHLFPLEPEGPDCEAMPTVPAVMATRLAQAV